MIIKSGSIVELMDLGPEPIDPRYAAYFTPGTRHTVLFFDPVTGEIELSYPGLVVSRPGDGVTFFPGEYKLIVE